MSLPLFYNVEEVPFLFAQAPKKETCDMLNLPTCISFIRQPNTQLLFFTDWSDYRTCFFHLFKFSGGFNLSRQKHIVGLLWLSVFLQREKKYGFFYFFFLFQMNLVTLKIVEITQHLTFLLINYNYAKPCESKFVKARNTRCVLFLFVAQK